MARIQSVAGNPPAPGAAVQSPQTSLPEPQAPPPTDDLAKRIAQVAQGGNSAAPANAPQEEDTDFLSRAYQASPIKGLVDMAKSEWDAAKQKTDEDQAVQQQIAGLIKSKDWGRAAELLLGHIAKRSGQEVMDLPGPKMVAGIAQNSYKHGKAAVNAASQGNIKEAIAQGAEAVPVLGQIAEQVGEPLGKDLKEGNYSGAAGDVVGGVASIAPLALGGEAEDEPAVYPGAPQPEPAITKGVRTVARDNVPVVEKVATPAEGLSKPELEAEKTATQQRLSKTYAKETEPAARKIVGKEATRAVRNSDAAAPAMETFEEAADYYKSKAQPTYDKLDELIKKDYKPGSPAKDTGVLDEQGNPIRTEAVPESGNKMSFSDMQRMERSGYRTLDFDQVDKAQQMQQDALSKYANQFKPGELDEAKRLWSKGSANQDIHEALNSPTVVGDTPDELVTNKNAPDPGMWRGKPLLRAIRKLNGVNADLSDSVFEKAGVPQASIGHLQGLGRVLTKEGNMTRFNSVFRQLAQSATPEPSVASQVGSAIAKKTVAAGVGGALGGPIGAGAAVAADQWLLPKLLEKIVMTPNAAKTLVTGMKSSVNAAAIANALRPYVQEKKKETIQ